MVVFIIEFKYAPVKVLISVVIVEVLISVVTVVM